MKLVMTDERLKLRLGADAELPSQCCWRIDMGYLRLMSLNEAGEYMALGVWGPGDLVIPNVLGVAHQKLLSLSPIQAEQWNPTPEEEQLFILDHLRQVSTLLVLSRHRPVEDRLLNLLTWLGERFGRVSSLGVSLSASEMNLSHRNLAEFAGTTRVTVTKALTRFKREGMIIGLNQDDLMIPRLGKPLKGIPIASVRF